MATPFLPAGAVFVAAAIPNAQSVACDTSPAGVSASVAAVEQRYRGVNTFVSDFTQTYALKAYAQKVTSTGHVVFSRTANMDWTFASPAGSRVVSDGVLMTTYDAPNTRAFVLPVSQAQSQYPVALAFLGPLHTNTALELLCGSQMAYPGGNVLVAAPALAVPYYDKLLLYVDATSTVRRVIILDGHGNTNRFDFATTTLNVPVPPTQFLFTAPPGVAVISPSPSTPPPPVPVLH